MKKIKISALLVFAVSLLLLFECKQNSNAQKQSTAAPNYNSNAKVTFIELGSVNCVPCKKMQPVMHRLEQKYGNQLQVIFYDVWKPNQKKFAKIFGIRVIPTQIFLDRSGHEFYRHEGFFPEYEIDRLLARKGLSIINRNSSDKND